VVDVALDADGRQERAGHLQAVQVDAVRQEPQLGELPADAVEGAFERRNGDRVATSASKLLGLSLFLLAADIAVDAGRALWLRDRPSPMMLIVLLVALNLDCRGGPGR
jgi:hypothetical protein